MSENFEVYSVPPVQAIVCPEPYKAIGVLDGTGYPPVGEAVSRGNPVKV